MYFLPEEPELSLITGKALLQVCIGANEVRLHFEGEITVSAHSDIGHRSGQRLTAMYETPSSAAAMLVRFLDNPVLGAVVQLPDTLVLEFANGEALEIHDTLLHREKELWPLVEVKTDKDVTTYTYYGRAKKSPVEKTRASP